MRRWMNLQHDELSRSASPHLGERIEVRGATATARHQGTRVNVKQSPRFHLPCLRDEKFYLESSRNRDQSLSDVSPEVSLRTSGRRCLYCFSRRSASLSEILSRRRNRIRRAAPNRARSHSCERVVRN